MASCNASFEYGERHALDVRDDLCRAKSFRHRAPPIRSSLRRTGGGRKEEHERRDDARVNQRADCAGWKRPARRPSSMIAPSVAEHVARVAERARVHVLRAFGNLAEPHAREVRPRFSLDARSRR